MRKFILLFLFIFIFAFPFKVLASGFEVVVLPVSSIKTTENYYNFKDVDEIVANDIINIFNSSNRIHSPDLYMLNAKLNSNPALKSSLTSALNQYNSTKHINYTAMKSLTNSMNARSIVLISAHSENPDGKVKKGVWESLNISSAFDIIQNDTLKVDVVLLDNVNDLVMWSSVYNFKLSDNSGRFQAFNYTQAVEQLEKIKLFSKNLLSRAIAQNVTLRFYPKSINPVDVKPAGDSIDSGLLKYNKNIPSIHRFGKNKTKPKTEEEESYGELIFQL